MSQVGEKAKPTDGPRRRQIPEAVEQEILAAVRGLSYGSVEIVVHDSQVVQLERKEKRRFSGDGS